MELNKEQRKRLKAFVQMDDIEFYEQYLSDTSLEEQAAFMKEFPDFLNKNNSILKANTQK